VIHPDLERFAVPIDSLYPLPGNPHKGNDAIVAESLVAHGQYTPVIVNQDRTILAGNTTWRVAKALGWTRIAAVEVPGDDQETVRRALVDNRAAALARYDDMTLLEVLEGLPDWDGTGYGADDVAELRERLDGPLDEPRSSGSGARPDDDGKPDVVVRVGTDGVLVPYEAFGDWRKNLMDRTGSKAGAIQVCRVDLGFPAVKARERLDAGDRAAAVAARSDRIKTLEASGVSGILLDKSTYVDIDALVPHPRNPRQGDLSVLTESLLTNGQYRPILYNRRTMQILKGKHTWQAARKLGWSKIAATYVDVDDEEADRIVLIDNRSSDVSEDDDRSLLAFIDQLGGNLDGTGFDEFDTEDLIERVESDMAASRDLAADGPPVRVAIGAWSFTVTGAEYAAWLAGVEDDPQLAIVDRLGLPEEWSAAHT
jgi:ParB-like chromosome segregation protein Spo0J